MYHTLYLQPASHCLHGWLSVMLEVRTLHSALGLLVNCNHGVAWQKCCHTRLCNVAYTLSLNAIQTSYVWCLSQGYGSHNDALCCSTYHMTLSTHPPTYPPTTPPTHLMTQRVSAMLPLNTSGIINVVDNMKHVSVGISAFLVSTEQDEVCSF